MREQIFIEEKTRIIQCCMNKARNGVFSVNYRLSGEATFPADIEDVKAAIRFIRFNAERYSQEIGIAGQIHNSEDSFESILMGKQITLIPELVAKHNPEMYVKQECPPLIIQHGWYDNIYRDFNRLSL